MKLVAQPAMANSGPLEAPREVVRRKLIDDLTRPARRSVRLSKWIAFLLLTAVVAGFGFAPIESGTVANGQLIVDGDRQVVQHGEGGLVAEILVKEGGRVAAGDVLLRLDPIQAGAAAGLVASEIYSLRAEEAVRAAEMAGAEQVEFPAYLLSLKSDAEIAQILSAQEGAFDARRSLAASERRRLAEQLRQIEQSRVSRAAEHQAAMEQAELLATELAGLETLLEKGLTQRPRVLGVERLLSEARGQAVSLEAEMQRLDAEAAETRTRRGQVEANRRAEAADALRTVRADLSAAHDRQAAASDTLKRTEIVAPTSGIVMDIGVNTIGGVIGAGEPLMAIVPQTEGLIIRARISPRDADDVRVGMDATVRFNAGGGRSAHRADGIVETVSADALVDERTGESYFEAQISVAPEAANAIPSELLAPGLPADVLIRTGESTAFRYFLGPIEDVMFKALRES